jgi:hypothetical protein
MEDLQAGVDDAARVGRERERNAPQLGGELLVRQARDEQKAVHVGQVGDRRGTDRLTQDAQRAFAEGDLLAFGLVERKCHVEPLVVLCWGVRERHLGDRDVDERKRRRRCVDGAETHQHRLAISTPATLHRQVHRRSGRMHRHIADEHVLRVTAQQRADAYIDVVEVERRREARAAEVTRPVWVGDVHRDDPRADVVGQEQDPGRAERDGTRGPDVGSAPPQPVLTHRGLLASGTCAGRDGSRPRCLRHTVAPDVA